MKPVTIENRKQRESNFLATEPSNREVHEHLCRHGLGGLDDPNLIHQMAFLIKDHNHFRSVILAVEPKDRRDAYEAMRPYLNFEPYPLDRYLLVLI